MRTVWKHKFKSHEESVLMPKGARILSVLVQQGDPTLWYLCDPTKQMESRRFKWVGTGQSEVPDDYVAYIGTVYPFNAELVLHCFEVSNG